MKAIPDPHAGQPVLRRLTVADARRAAIMIHGRGASQGILQLAREFHA
jgi:hypothetical protein